jgi:hypothetical protein
MRLQNTLNTKEKVKSSIKQKLSAKMLRRPFYVPLPSKEDSKGQRYS